MERVTIEQAKKLFGNNFLGLTELQPLFDKMGLDTFSIKVPEIHYALSDLEKYSKDYILVLGLAEIGNTKISIQTFRDCFGVNPDVSEPCFYNQDWYLNEEFIQMTLNVRWYLLRKKVLEASRAVQPNDLLKQKIIFPSAILCVYTFYAYYYAYHEILWSHDFVWCNDMDHNNDRIYVGKYHDIDGINRDGFSIHRHLALRNCYSSINYF